MLKVLHCEYKSPISPIWFLFSQTLFNPHGSLAVTCFLNYFLWENFFLKKSKYTVSVWFLFTFSVSHTKNAETSLCLTHVLWGIYTSTLAGYLIQKYVSVLSVLLLMFFDHLLLKLNKYNAIWLSCCSVIWFSTSFSIENTNNSSLCIKSRCLILH